MVESDCGATNPAGAAARTARRQLRRGSVETILERYLSSKQPPEACRDRLLQTFSDFR